DESTGKLEQYVFNESFQVQRHLSMSPNHHGKFTREFFRQAQSLKRPFLSIESKSTHGHETHPHTKRYEIYDEVKIIELHRWLNEPSLLRHPRTQPLAGVRAFLKQQPLLFRYPRPM